MNTLRVVTHISNCQKCFNDSAIKESLIQYWKENDPLILSSFIITLLSKIEEVHKNENEHAVS